MSQLPFSPIFGEPNLKTLLDLYKKEIFLSLNCHAIATVQSFDATTQTITATINYAQVYYQKDTAGNYVQQLIDYPPLVECPIVNLCGGGNYLTFPVAKGDQCLIFFADRDLDNYFANQNTKQLASSRLHSFQDAIALVFTGNVEIANYSTDHVLLTNGTVKLGYKPSTNRVTIATGNTTLLSELSSLMTALNNFATSCSAATTVANIAAAAATLSTALGNVSFGSVLE